MDVDSWLDMKWIVMDWIFIKWVVIKGVELSGSQNRSKLENEQQGHTLLHQQSGCISL